MNDHLIKFLNLQNITQNEADLYFYGDIVSDYYGAWDDTDQYPESIRTFLNKANGKKLNIHINSGGGSVFAGIAIFNMLKNYSGEKVVYVDGLAGSIASVIAFSGDRVVMRTGSTLMIHKPMACLMGAYNSDDLTKMATNLDAIQECIMQVYSENMIDGVDFKKVIDMVNAETYLSSDEALKYFNVEKDSLEAVACSSEYLDRIINRKNPKVGQLKAKLKLLKLEEK